MITFLARLIALLTLVAFVGCGKQGTDKSGSKSSPHRKSEEDDDEEEEAFKQVLRDPVQREKLLEKLREHPLFREEEWLALPERASDPSRPADKERAVKELQLNGADLTENEVGAIVVVNLSHGKPRQAKRRLTPGLKLFRFLPDLTAVGLYNSLVTDEDLENLKPLTKLTDLELGWTKIGDKGLAHLEGLANLEYLGLYNTKVTDAGLKSMAPLKRLRRLFLASTRVTDAGLVHLEGLSRLEELRLGQTGVSKAGADRLRKCLPKCQISME